MQRKDGSRFYASVVMDAIYNDAGDLVVFAKLARDITSQYEVQAALEKTREQLAQSQKLEAPGQPAGGVAEVTAILVEQLGYRVVRAESADEALRHLQQGVQADLAFSDIVMPGGMNGIVLAQTRRELYPGIPVLLTTGFTDATQAAEGRFVILRKPFELPALESAIDAALRERRRAVRAKAG